LEHSIRKVDTAGTITTIAGTGIFGFNGDGLKARSTHLNSPAGLAIDRCGNLLVADRGNDRVRLVNLAGPCTPQTPRPTPGSSRPWAMLLMGAIILALGAAMALASRARRAKKDRRGAT